MYIKRLVVYTERIKINAIYYWENYGIYINTIFSTHYMLTRNKSNPNLRCIMNDERNISIYTKNSIPYWFSIFFTLFHDGSFRAIIITVFLLLMIANRKIVYCNVVHFHCLTIRWNIMFFSWGIFFLLFGIPLNDFAKNKRYCGSFVFFSFLCIYTDVGNFSNGW